ncbi:hypothetical protein HFN_1627 [Helicobacter fennelliae MRY12-0050]|uniref:Uncharacterized protein n=1 Tax=Helicobacter fennelliae MRY12-0050 TaxID=1325130 RepID=T1CMP2_9HELI|nr:hypothetical protein HFN_1627 [Helicobacter fennelliae MRY12-0050]
MRLFAFGFVFVIENLNRVLTLAKAKISKKVKILYFFLIFRYIMPAYKLETIIDSRILVFRILHKK